MPNYRSNTSTTDPYAAASPDNVPPSDAQTLRNMFNDGMARLNAFQPQNDETARGKQRLLGVGAQLDMNIEAAEQNPFALQGLAQQITGWRRSVFGLIGNYGTINGQQLYGLGAVSSSSSSVWWKWAALAGGVGAIGLGFWWAVRSSARGQGTGLGAVHETKLKLHETRIPSAKPSK